MISTITLQKDIKKVLQNGFTDFQFRAPGQGEKYRAPKIYIQNLGVRRESLERASDAPESKAPPYILVKFLKAAAARERYTADFAIVYVAYDDAHDPESGAEDAMNMHDRILMLLCGRREWADKHFIREFPVNSAFEPSKAADAYDTKWQLTGPVNGGVIFATFYAAPLPEAVPSDLVDALEPGTTGMIGEL